MRKLIVGLLVLPFILFSCSNDDYEPFRITLDQSQITMHYDEEEQLSLHFSHELLNGFSYVWFSGDTNVVTVTQEGLVKGVRIGETTVTVYSEDENLQAQCVVTIEPKSSFFQEPYYEFGESVSFIKSKEERVLIEELPQRLVYEGENENVLNIYYQFQNDSLTTINNILPMREGIVEEAFEFLRERYRLVYTLGENNGYFELPEGKGSCSLMDAQPMGYLLLYSTFDATTLDAKTVKEEDIFRLLNELRQKALNLLQER